MLEDDFGSDPATFARDLTSLLQLPDAAGVRGLVVGRFQRASAMTRHLLEQIVARQPRLAGLPVLAGVDFGHTQPQATLPIGGQVALTVGDTSRSSSPSTDCSSAHRCRLRRGETPACRATSMKGQSAEGNTVKRRHRLLTPKM